MARDNLRGDAAQIRNIFLRKNYPRGNVAVAEVHLAQGIVFGMGATSRGKSPAMKPKPRSQGGHFEPSIDSYSRRPMDTDAEYKLLSAIADTLEGCYNRNVQGQLYLYTERQPCESSQRVIEQFQQKFPNIEIFIDWSYPYPPI